MIYREEIYVSGSSYLLKGVEPSTDVFDLHRIVLINLADKVATLA